MAGILHTICCDDKQRFLRSVFLSGILMDIPDVMNRSAQCIQKRCTTSDIILVVIHGLNSMNRHPIIKHLRLIVEENCGDIGFSLFLLLFCDHRIESTNRISLKATHGTASVQNKH